MTPVTPKMLLDGGRYFEVRRWHAGRLWFVDCLNGRCSVSPLPESASSTPDRRRHTVRLGILPDGRIAVLTMFRKRLMACADGRLSLYADLSGWQKARSTT